MVFSGVSDSNTYPALKNEWEEIVVGLTLGVTGGSYKIWKLIGGSLDANLKRVGGTWTLIHTYNTQTLHTVNSFADKFHLATYWNGGGNNGTKLWISSARTDFIVGNVIKGGTSLTENTITITEATSLDLTGVSGDSPPLWTEGETITEYDPTGTTPTGVTSTISNMYPPKHQYMRADDIVITTTKPAWLP